jgi:hypothetical protein
VAVGATRRGVLYLNLEAFRLITLTGDTEAQAACLSLLLRRLQQAIVSGGCEGYVADPARQPDRQTDNAAGLIRPVDDVVRAIHRRARAVSQGLAGSGCVSAFEARINGGNRQRFRPLIVVADSALSEVELDRLLDGCRRSSAVTAMFASSHAASDLVLDCRDGRVWLPFLSGVPVTLPAAPEIEASDETVVERGVVGHSEIGDKAKISNDRDLNDTTELVPPEPSRDMAPLTAPAPSDLAVLVRVIGPIDVQGSAGPLVGKSLELIAYMSCHDEGVSGDRIKAALWPERAPRPHTWENRVSECRRLLGTNRHGEMLLPHFEGGIARLNASVCTDVSLLEAALEQSDADPALAMAVLRESLELVRGRPFETSSGYEWAYRELHVAHTERAVVDASHRLVTLALRADDWRLALWASEQGLMAAPDDEAMHQDRMRAFHAGGDARGVEAAMRDLLGAVGARSADGALQPETVELYEQLHGRSSAAKVAAARKPTE